MSTDPRAAFTPPRDWFAIGIEHPKTETNIGTLWRTAYSLGAAYIFTIGRRYKRQSSDTINAAQKIPLFHYATLAEFVANRPVDALLVGVELDPRAQDIRLVLRHPARVVYLLGAEDNGLSQAAMAACNKLVVLPGATCHNVAVAGALVMYDRLLKGATGRMPERISS